MKKLTVLFVVGALAGATFLGGDGRAGDKKNPAVAPINRDIARHKQFLANIKNAAPEVIFLGDSITQGWEGAGKAAWKKHFEPLKAFNLGIGGDQTGHVLWRLTEGGEWESIKPKVCVVMIGTNNTGKHSAEDIAGSITEIVRTIHKKSPTTKVLLLAVFPRGAQAGTPIREKIATINKIISKLDDGKTVRYLDIGEKFLQKDGTLTKDIMPDFLHLSA